MATATAIDPRDELLIRWRAIRLRPVRQPDGEVMIDNASHCYQIDNAIEELAALLYGDHLDLDDLDRMRFAVTDQLWDDLEQRLIDWCLDKEARRKSGMSAA